MRRTALGGLAAAVLLLTGCASQGVRAAAPTAGPAAPAPSGRTPHGTLLVTDFGADTVTFVDPRRGAFDSVRVGTAPYGLAVGDDGRAWVATAEGVAVVDTATRERITRIPYRTAGIGAPVHGEYRGGGMGIALAPDGRQVYVGVNRPGTTGTVEVIDTRTLKSTGTAEVGRRPFDVDVAPDGRAVYATDHDSFDVTVVTPGSLRTRRIEVAPYGTEGGLGSWLKPHHAAVRPSDGKLLLPFEGEKLVVLDPVTGRSRIERMTARTHQHGATVTPDGTLFVVGTGAVGEDNGPSLTVRAPGGRERVIALDGPHEDVAVTPDGRTAYVTGGFTRDGYWNGISVVDVASGTVHRLAAGQRPLDIAVL
ncbi:YncE family protein [Streptomyces catenulae]|uniref:YncE family protein n=1 Tax=Streptomyces catenulae TaxID=66875 RepID=A0ABV2YSB1_9ACTN|nr:YncE family protein [Streptomyces catenulae]